MNRYWLTFLAFRVGAKITWCFRCSIARAARLLERRNMSIFQAQAALLPGMRGQRKCQIILTPTLGAIVFILNGCAPAVVIGGAAGIAAIATDPRTAGTVIDDQSIEFRIANGLYSDKELANSTHISITSFNHIVLISGEAPSAELRTRAYNIVKADPDVKRIYNEITIAEPLPLKARNYDSWLTAKVKSTLLGAKDVDTLNIKVVTSNTTVYLMGLTPRENGQKVAEIVSNVQGVRKVVKAFEYTEKIAKPSI